MREIKTHIVNPVNDQLRVMCHDEPSHGGACHKYSVVVHEDQSDRYPGAAIHFQNGPINENGINGVTHESLLAIVQDRLEHFQKGPYACRENAIALTHLETAILWLKKRTLDRMARGVEGTHQK